MPKKPGITFITFSDEVALGVRTLHAVLTVAGFPCRIIFFQGWKQLGQWPSEAELQILFELIEKEDSEVFGLSGANFYICIRDGLTRFINSSSCT